ncbi:MAG: 2-oxo acid dehydrogenase subunit E2 [Brevefilum sp.]
MPSSSYEITFPAVRQFTADVGKLSKEKHTIQAFIEVDVTDALARIKTLRSPAYKVSFLAWFIKVLVDTVEHHPPVNGIKKGRKRVVVFKQVDVSTIFEKLVEQVAVPLPLVVRRANAKSPLQISQEIQDAVNQPLQNQKSPGVGAGDNKLLIMLGLILPQWLRLFIMRNLILRNPKRMQATMGTVLVTSLGTVGQISTWILPTSIHPLSIGIGTLVKKPYLVGGEVQSRQILHLTVALDHDVIDGMPARAFIADLVDRLSRGYALEYRPQ